MHKLYKTILIFSVLFFLRVENSMAQCHAIDSLTYSFLDPNGGGEFTGYLCTMHDSVGTRGQNGYYSGDAYRINLVMGSDVIFSTDSCNGTKASITITDSLNTFIPGAYASDVCPNSLNFTAPYTGTYYVVLNKNGNCNSIGSTLIGQVYAQIDPSSSVPDCPIANLVNDTLCGATPLTLNGSVEEGNSAAASQTDPLDSYVTSIGFMCSPPNNTLWYSFSPQTNIDTLNIWITSAPGGGFHSWLAVFTANDSDNICSADLSYIGCAEGPNDAGGIDTVSIPLFGLQGGHIYYFMIDGYNGGSGEFSIAVRSASFPTGLNLISNENDFSVFPNPTSGNVIIKMMKNEHFKISVSNSLGEEIINKGSEGTLKQEIQTSQLPGGLYIIKISGPHGMLSKKLLIIK